MMTNADLRRLTNEYARRFFGNKLPPVEVRFGELERGTLGVTLLFGGVAEIRISRQLRRWPKVAKATLIHELCHAYLPARVMHGAKFQTEMRRIANLGGFNSLW